DDVRQQLAAVTYERIALADREYRRDERDDLVNRLALYDDGTFTLRLVAPGRLTVALEPPGATAVLTGAMTPGRPVPAGVLDVASGSYVLVATAPGRATVRMPFVIRAGEQQRIAFALPAAAAIPDGFVYIPAGRFLYGIREIEAIRQYLGAAPMHERTTPAYLIAVTELTYAQWIEFLDDLPPVEQTRRAPLVATSSTLRGELALRNVGGTWELSITPATSVYRVRAGAPIEYRDRAVRARQNWLRFPVTGISAEDAQAYTEWLDRTGRVPHARLCRDAEWERAMRGADGRSYPHGEHLDPDDANIDITYGRREGGFGPDEVGSHPASNSPFQLADGAGNAWEIVRSGSVFEIRGGCFYNGIVSAHMANREPTVPTLRHILTGVRICADPP
ncbi:MAG TPA: SUMF1/EgtB/PvdO family nonheme iron enzyme, partial [Thermoanaerobaculia bacterium]